MTPITFRTAGGAEFPAIRSHSGTIFPDPCCPMPWHLLPSYRLPGSQGPTRSDAGVNLDIPTFTRTNYAKNKISH